MSFDRHIEIMCDLTLVGVTDLASNLAHQIAVTIEPTRRLTAAEKEALQGAVRRYGRFMKIPATLSIAESRRARSLSE